MSSSDRPSLVDLPHRIRDRLAALPEDWRAWRAATKEDPREFWRPLAVRVVAILIIGTVGVLALGWAIDAFIPRLEGADQQAAPTATLYVACSDPNCGAAFTITRGLDFKDWPVTCPKCGQQTGYRATRCPVCRQWYSHAPGTPDACPQCARKAAAAQQNLPQRPQPSQGADAEDPW